MDSLSLDHFRQQQTYQRNLLIGSNNHKSKKRHSKDKKSRRSHKSHREHGSHRHHRHHRRKSRKDYGSVNDQCAVCLDDETELDTRLFPCKHVFHGECLIEWVRQGESFTCPLCRQQISHFLHLSNDDKINSELVSIWNDHYLVSEDKSDSTADKLDDQAAKEIALVVESETAATTQGSTTSSSFASSTAGAAAPTLSEDQALEEIARLKNKEINENLGIMSDDSSSVMTDESNEIPKIITQDTQKVFDFDKEPKATASETEVAMKTVTQATEEAKVEAVLMPLETMKEEAIELEKHQTLKRQSVWESTWSTMTSKTNNKSKESRKNSLKQLLLPNSTYLMFDKYVAESLVDNIEKEETANDEDLMSNNVLFSENGVSNSEDYEMEFARINESMNFINGNTFDSPNGINNEDSESYASMMLTSNDINNNNDNNGDSVSKSAALLKHTSTNCEAGIYAGIGASVATYGLTNAHARMMPQALRTSLMPLMKETVPNVAAFFTSYEHLKTYAFECDATSKSHSQTFLERFVSAGVASSIAFLPRNNVLSLGLKCALPLRFAAFFGSFELCKDLKMEFNFLNGNYSPLNLTEIAGSAAIGSVAAAGIHYPITQMITHSNEYRMLLSFNNFTNTSNPFTATAAAVNKQAALETLYRGFVPHLARFVPSTVACSCAFEFAKRAVHQRKET